MAEQVKRFYATGRRKTAVARVWISVGEGEIQINKKSLDDYFKVPSQRADVMRPFAATSTAGKYKVLSTITGGGTAGQAGALRHGIARALEKVDGTYRAVLKKEGLLTRDPRSKERKKPGQKGARARFQFSKR
jgi:small subunit ribosomal protein S9